MRLRRGNKRERSAPLPDLRQLWTGEVKLPAPSFAGDGGTVTLAVSLDEVSVMSGERVLATATRTEVRHWFMAPAPRFQFGDVVFSTQGSALTIAIGSTIADPLPTAAVEHLRASL